MIPCSSTSSSRAWNSSLVIDLRSSGYDTAGNLTEHGRALQSAAMIVDVDHVILAVSRDDHAHFSDRLRGSGFVHADAGRHVGQGTANENLALAGGQYLELLFPDPPPDPPRGWYESAPHILGLCLRSTDVDADASGGTGPRARGRSVSRRHSTTAPTSSSSSPGRTSATTHRSSSSCSSAPSRRSRSSGRRLVSNACASAARTRRAGVTPSVSGSASSASGGSASVGEVELRFEEDSRPGLTVDAEFAVPHAEGDLPLARGHIALRRR